MLTVCARVALALLIAAAASPLAAQPSSPPAESSTQLLREPGLQSSDPFSPAGPLIRLSYDDVLWVTAENDEPVKGRLRAWSGSTLEWIGPDGLVRTPLAELRRVEAADPITNGAWKGALGGLAGGGTIGLLMSVALSCERDCGQDYSRNRDIASGALGFGAFSAAGGALLGVLTDMLVHRRRVVFERQSETGLRLVPSAEAGRGVALRLSW